MPLKHGKSKKTLQENIKTEIEHGKDPRQAAAIAYSVRRKSMQKMAEGGMVEESCEHGGPKHCAMGCYAEGGMVEGDDHMSRPDYIDELENEPMGNSFHSDEFLADPYGEMTSNHHSEYDPDVEEEEHDDPSESSFHAKMEYNPKKRLEKIMAKRRIAKFPKQSR